MRERTDTTAQIRELLDRLADAERLPKDERELLSDEVATAARALPRDGILDALDRAIGKSKKRLRHAVYILSELGDVPGARHRIVSGLDSPDPEWRSWLIQTIEQRSMTGCGAAIERIIVGDPDAFCRDVAIHAAGTLRLSECLPAILTLGREGRCPWAVLWALKDYATEECRPLLVRYFERGNDEDLRVVAAWGLAKLREPEPLAYLVQMLDDPDERGDTYFHPGQSIRAAQAVSDIYGWPFTWNKASVSETKERVATLRRGPTSGCG